MTPRKLWVSEAHIRSYKIHDFLFFLNLRQDFDIYLNIDHQKTKKLKKETKEKNKTHKQTKDQTNKQTGQQRNNETKKQTSNVVFFCPMQWFGVLRAAKRNK